MENTKKVKEEENCEKQVYKKLNYDEPSIGLLMMVKNETKRIEITLKSVIGFVDAIIIYDTGSTDDTLKKIKEFAEKEKINLYIKKGNFVNFSESRNISLSFAETIDVHYLLLLDCNDELKGGVYLKLAAKDFFNKSNNGFLVCQEWWSGISDKYYNIRFIKNRCGWRYQGSVHEWLKDTLSNNDKPRYNVIRLMDEIILYQDRTLDDDKTSKRFIRDKELLLQEHLNNPEDSRTIFYLAQTCQCLKQYEEAFFYSKLRLKFVGFYEERFHSYMRCAQSLVNMGKDWHDCMPWYIKAYEEFNRAEPLVKIADYYHKKAFSQKNKNFSTFNLWNLAWFFIDQACKLSYPEHCNLFVDKSIYDYYRWHLMGIIAFYVEKYEEGEKACLIAINKENKELDKNNLEFYIQKLRNKEKNDIKKDKKIESMSGCFFSETEKKENNITKSQQNIQSDNSNNIINSQENRLDDIEKNKKKFIKKKIAELRIKFPELSLKKLLQKANTSWKTTN